MTLGQRSNSRICAGMLRSSPVASGDPCAARRRHARFAGVLEYVMSSLNRGLSLLCILGLTGATLAQDLPTDPSLVTGQLENGLRYVVRKHSNPPGKAVIWIHFDSGSLNETDRQRGLAHYLEHMAFNGSENFPPGSLVPLFQSLGMTFGRDQNAFTNFEQTTYQLTLPDTK